MAVVGTISEDYIQSHRTKNASRGYKVVCPSCGGNDLWVTPDNGKAFCWECSAYYSVGDAPKTATRQVLSDEDVEHARYLYGRACQEYEKRLTPDCRTYLHRRGINDDHISEFRLGYCPPSSLPLYSDPIASASGLVHRSGEAALLNRITLPYLHGDAVTDFRGRAVYGEEPKYKSLNHWARGRGASMPFNYGRAYARAKAQGFVVITEGEIKALLADIFGFPAVAFPGMQSIRLDMAFDAHVVPIVVYDSTSDPVARVRVDQAILSLVDKLPPFKVATLPLLGEDKQDIDSYLMHSKGGADRFARILEDAVTCDMYRRLRRF